MGLMLSLMGSKKWSRGSATLPILLALAACSGDDKTTTTTDTGPIKIGDPVDVNGDGKPDGFAVDSDGDGVADGVDLDGDGKADVPLPGQTWDGGAPPMCTGPLCNPVDEPPAACGKTSYELKATKTNVMFLIDGSNSMSGQWSTIKDSLVKIINANPELNFGVHIFYAEQANLGEFIDQLNACGEVKHPRLEVGPMNGQKVVNAMGGAPPGPGAAFFDSSPVLAGLNYYLQNDTPLNDPKSSNFLVVVSDLVDTCFGTLFSSPESVNDGAGSEQLLAFEKLAVELRKRHIRALPLGFNPNPSNMSMGGATGDVNVKALEALTKLGGTSVKAPLIATNATDLKKAITEIGVAVQPCRFEIPAVSKDGLNAFKLSFLINNQIIPRDRTKNDGWDFVEGNTSEVEFYGDACRALQTGAADMLDARLECEGMDVCGTAATKVTTRSRALHILLDGSASMWGNPLNPIFNNELTPWGQATKGLAGMVTAPINDDLEFGFQFFPAGANDQCDIGAPEVAIGPSSEISIVETMVGKIPTGSTPLVGGLQYVAANPGRLADNDVLSGVLVVSDGGDSCGGTQASRNADLAAAATSLYNNNIKTYAVRFGEAADQAQAEQLTNIAVNGGTNTFFDAPDQAGLEAILEMISGEFASCELNLGALDASVDPTQVNLYLNGILIKYDDQGAKTSGWGWKTEYSKIELYGPECALLQKSRLSDIVLELGCATVPVI